MMGGFYIRFNAQLSREELQTLINKAKLRVVEVENSGTEFNAYILLVGRHWWVAIQITPYSTRESEYIYLCENENNERCMKELEEDLKPKWLFSAYDCYDVSAVIEQDTYNQYRFDVDWRCHEVRRYAVFNVEINTNYIDQHDIDVLKIVARRVAGLNVRDVVRPM